MEHCPTLEEIRDFCRGSLARARWSWLALHIAGCESCAASLEAIEKSEGSLLEQLRHMPSVSGAEDLELGALISAAAQIAEGEFTGGSYKGAPPNDDSERDYSTVSPEPSATGEHSELPSAIGPYQILGHLGAGGMGTVYRAYHAVLDRVVALKTVRPDRAHSAEHHERFRREALSAARLNHPGIVPVYEVGEHEGRPYFAMGYVVGQSLGERLADGPLAMREAAELMLAIAGAIEYAHSEKIIHRDLKPSNILLDQRNQPHITDFGLAKSIESDDSFTNTNQILGTPSYMSPEQAQGLNQQVSTPTDIYAMGAVLYAMLTGRPPFQSANVVELLRQVVEQQPVPPRQLNADVDADLETICLHCLRKEPERRFPSSSELADELERYLEGKAIHVRPMGRWERFNRWRRRQPATAALAAGLLLVTVLGFAGVSWQWYEAETARADLETNQESLRQERTKATQSAIENRRLFEAEREARRKVQAARAGEQAALLKEQSALRKEQIARDRAERTAFARQLEQIAQRMVTNPSEAIRLLEDSERCPRDWRGFAWRYLLGQCENDFELPGKWRGFSISQDEKTIALWDAANELAWWDVEKRETKNKTPLPGRVVDVAPNHQFVALVGESGMAIHEASGKRLASLAAPADSTPTFVAFSSDSQRVAVAYRAKDGPGGIMVAKPSSGQVVKSLACQQGYPSHITFLSDGQRLAAGVIHPTGASPTSSVQVWDVDKAQVVAELPGESDKHMSLSAAPDGSRLAIGRGSWTDVWRIESDETMQLPVRQYGTFSSAFSPDGAQLATGSGQSTIEFWNLATQAKQLRFEKRLKLRFMGLVAVGRSTNLQFRQLDLFGGGTHMASRDATGEVCLWELAPPPSRATQEVEGQEFWSIAAAGGNRVVAASAAYNSSNVEADGPLKEPGRLVMWDASTGEQLGIFGEFPDGALSVAVSPDGRLLASGHAAGLIRLWNLETRHQIAQLDGDRLPVQALAFSPDGSRIASGSGFSHIYTRRHQGAFKLWDTASREAVVSHTNSGAVLAVAFSPSGELCAFGGNKKTVRFVAPSTGEIEPSGTAITGFSGSVWSLAFDPAPGRNHLAVGSGEYNSMHPLGRRGGAVIWNLDDGRRVASLEHGSAVFGVAYSPRGRTLATCDYLRQIHLWDPHSGVKRLSLPETHGRWIRALTFTTNGKYLATASGDQTCRFWGRP